MTVFAIIFTAACTGDFQVDRKNKTFVTTKDNSHQAQNKSINETAAELRKLEIDVTDVTYSKQSLEKYYFDSKIESLEKISTLLNDYIRTGVVMIDMGDNDEATVVTVENAKQLKSISTSYAFNLSPEHSF